MTSGVASIVRRAPILIAALCLIGAAVPGHEARDADAYIKGELRLTRYKSAVVDLDGSRRPAVLVYAEGPQDCGSGGCDLYILKPVPGCYRLVTRTSVTQLPVRILPGSSHGWRDLGVQVAGGGIVVGYEARLRFDGSTYPENPTVRPAEPLSTPTGRVVLK